jgi:HAD superfamily hydrolase (TIGR01509 family)
VLAAARAWIFDYDGLIVDSERVEADHVIAIVGEWGATVTYSDFGHLFGSVDADHHWDELLQGWCGRTITELEAAIHERLGDYSVKEHLPLLPGVREHLDEAKGRGIALGIATGNTYEAIERRLGRHGVFDRFDAVVTRRDVAEGKPAPDIFLEVARRLEVDPAECIVFEDSVPGCEGALAAGMRVVACPSVVSAHCECPDGVERVASLLDVVR